MSMLVVYRFLSIFPLLAVTLRINTSLHHCITTRGGGKPYLPVPGW